MKRYTPEQAIRDVKAQRKRILRVLRPFARKWVHIEAIYGVGEAEKLPHSLEFVTRADMLAAAKLYKDLGGR